MQKGDSGFDELHVGSEQQRKPGWSRFSQRYPKCSDRCSSQRRWNLVRRRQICLMNNPNHVTTVSAGGIGYWARSSLITLDRM